MYRIQLLFNLLIQHHRVEVYCESNDNSNTLPVTTLSSNSAAGVPIAELIKVLSCKTIS